MRPECKTIPMFEGLTMTSAGTVFGVVDTKGFDFCIIDVCAGTGEAASTAITELNMSESDTLLTAVSDGTAVTAFVGASAISTSAGFVLPALSSTTSNVYQMNVDLRGRKRYLAIDFAPAKQTVGVSGVAHLFNANDAADIAVAGTAVAGMRVIARG
jgi:hypothetical protein